MHRTKLYEQIVLQIQDIIGKGKLKPGDRLPAERELARIFNVSRHCVREAIRILEQKGIVRSILGSGTIVVHEDESSVIDVLSTAIHRKKTKLSEIFVFRRLIEPQIARLSAKNAAQANIDELEKIYIEQKNHDGTTRAFGLIDQKFHLALTRATGNSTLFQVVQLISNLLLKSREEYLQSPKRRQLSLQGHARILNAIKERNPNKAGEAMENHLANVEDIIMAHSKNRL